MSNATLTQPQTYDSSVAPDSRRPSLSSSNESCGDSCQQNVAGGERLASSLIGSAIVLAGLSRGKLSGLALAAIGGSLVYRGWSGHCYLYESMGIDTAGNDKDIATGVPAQRGVKVDESLVINRPAEELFAFWRDLENLPSVLSHINQVEAIDSKTSRWTANGPLGMTVQWEAEIFNEREPELIAWRSLPGSQIDTAGSIRFNNLDHDRGTAVTVSLKYDPPAGKIGDKIASLLGIDAEQQIREDLRRFKRQMEAGEQPVVQG